MPPQKLIPLQVPWQLSTDSGFNADIIQREFDPMRLVFAAKIRVNGADFPNKVFTVSKIQPECEFENEGQIVGTTLTLTFRGPTWIKVHPLPLDQDVQAFFKFDLSDIPYDLRPHAPQKVDEWMALWNTRHCEWLKSGICPIPYAYEVTDSAWIEEINALYTLMKIPQRGLHHYLLATYEMFYEIIAADFSWTSEVWTRDENEE